MKQSELPKCPTCGATIEYFAKGGAGLVLPKFVVLATTELVLIFPLAISVVSENA